MKKLLLVFLITGLTINSHSQTKFFKNIGLNAAVSVSDMGIAISPCVTYKFKKNEFELGPIILPEHDPNGLNGFKVSYQVYPNEPNNVFDLLFFVENKFARYTDRQVFRSGFGSPNSVSYFYDNIKVLANESILGFGFKTKFLKVFYQQLDFGLGMLYSKHDFRQYLYGIDKEYDFTFQLRLKLGFRN